MKTKHLIVVLLPLYSFYCVGQIIDIDYRKAGSTFLSSSETTEGLQILKSGFVDVLTDGNIQASARLMRINIGEIDKFYIPFYIYTGVAGNAFGSEKANETTVANLLNPIGGIVNLSINQLHNLIPSEGITKLRFTYQLGARVVSNKDTVTLETSSFFNSLGNVGLFFQTGAWTPDDPTNMGIFYLQAKLSGSLSSDSKLKQIFGAENIENNYFIGYSIDAGIEINKVINIKLGVYQYTNNQAISLLKDPIVKLSVDYSIKD